MGIVYHGHYATYLEVARVEALRALGICYADLESQHGILLPVVNLHLRFLRPAYYDDVLRVQTTIPDLPEKNITFHSEIFRENGNMTAMGRVSLCFLKSDTRERLRMPAFLRDKLSAHFEEEQD